MTTKYHTQTAWILAALATFSLFGQAYRILTSQNTIMSIMGPVFAVAVYVGYILLFLVGFPALALTDKRWAWWIILALSVAFLAISVLYFPLKIYANRPPTMLEWLENDVFIGLQSLVAYLSIQRLRNVVLAPDTMPE